MSKTTRKAVIGGIALLLIVVVVTFIQRSSGRSALERYKAELRAKGEKLTYKELGVTLSTNSEDVAALQILAGYSSNYASLSSSVFPQMMDYVSPGKARVAWRGELRSDGGSGVTSTADWKTLESDIQRAAPALEQIRPALLVSPPDSGWVYQDTFASLTNGPPRTFIRDRIIAQALQRDLVNKLHRGDLDGALNDLHALTGQVRMNRNDPTLVRLMIRVAIAGLSLSATWEALQAPGWDESRLAAIQRNWAEVEFTNGLERAFGAERAVASIVMAEVRQSGVESVFKLWIGGPSASPPDIFGARLNRFWTDRVSSAFYRLTGSADQDELMLLQCSTQGLELVRALDSGRPWPEVDGELKTLSDEIEKKRAEDHFHRLRMSAAMLPSYSRFIRATANAETQRRLTITAIAIKRYELRHGQPPPALAALTPEFLAKVPLDLMSGKELCYHLSTNGGSVLYSVGDDGKDDGGTAGMGLWSAPDAVWPTAATPEEEDALKGTITKK